MHIRRNFPYDRAHGRPTGHGHNRGLAIITTRYPGPFHITFCPRKYPCRLTSNFFPQPDSVHTVQDALAHISRPRFAQVGPSGPSTDEASPHVMVLIETLPTVLVLQLKRFSYDATTGGVIKNTKHIKLSSELEIPPGTFSLPPLSP
jgi:Ubiquitin carboxyl-terminal hydrolase